MSLLGPNVEMIASQYRIPKDLHHELAQEAQQACRSLNAEIIWRLRHSLQRQLGATLPTDQQSEADAS